MKVGSRVPHSPLTGTSLTPQQHWREEQTRKEEEKQMAIKKREDEKREKQRLVCTTFTHNRHTCTHIHRCVHKYMRTLTNSRHACKVHTYAQHTHMHNAHTCARLHACHQYGSLLPDTHCNNKNQTCKQKHTTLDKLCMECDLYHKFQSQ